MQIATERKSDKLVIVRIEGQMDSDSSGQVETQLISLINAGVEQLVIDCGGLSYTNSMGLRVFLKATKAIKLKGGAIVLCALSAGIQHIFEIAGFCSIFDIVATRAEALAKF